MVFIIVEGQTDKALVKNILSDKVENTDFKFLGLKSISNVGKEIKNINEKDLSKNRYFAIIDANNSFSDRIMQMLEATKNKDIESYIFPNHKDNGDLKTLLRSNIGDNKILNYFDTYKNYIDKKIDNKTKLYAYTTLELGQKQEEYIKNISINDKFDNLKQKL